jgi:hypothetical protein
MLDGGEGWELFGKNLKICKKYKKHLKKIIKKLQKIKKKSKYPSLANQ